MQLSLLSTRVGFGAILVALVGLQWIFLSEAYPFPEGHTTTSTLSLNSSGWRGVVRSSTVAESLDRLSGLVAPIKLDNGEPGRTITRGLLLPVRGLTSLLYAPAQGALYALDRYNLIDTIEGFFFDSTRTYGAFPVLFIETPFGISLGAQGVHRSLFGEKEELNVLFAFGGRFQQRYRFSLTSGERISRRLQVSTEAYFDRVPRELFYGVGNQRGLTDIREVNALIDPFAPDAPAVQTSFSRTAALAAFRLRYILNPKLHLKTSVAWWYSSFGDPLVGDDPPAGDIYDDAKLLFAEGGIHTVSYQLRMIYDGRTSLNRYISMATPSSGWRLDGALDMNHVLSDDDFWYLRYTWDIQRNLNLHKGTRVLVLRWYTEGTQRAPSEVPPYDLPRLGGPTLLRGYVRDRFRDQAVTLLSVEYEWLINNGLRAFVFVDMGRTFRAPEDIVNDYPHIGFGTGFELFTYESLVARIQVTSSLEGNVLFSLLFEDIFEARTRHER